MLCTVVVCCGAGCSTVVREGPRYSLCKPLPEMIRYRVANKDNLALTLADGSVVKLNVAKVDAVSIQGQDGVTVAIADIHELQNMYVETVGEGATQAVVLGGMLSLGLLALPVGVAMALMFDPDALDNWNDDRLCRTVGHPEQYGYADNFVPETSSDLVPFEEIQGEIARRGLSCDALERAQKRCAFMYNSGPDYLICVSLATPIESAGLLLPGVWADPVLCEVTQNPAFYLKLADRSEGKAKDDEVIAAAREEVGRRGLTCSPALLAPPDNVWAARPPCPVAESDSGPRQ